MTWRSGWRSVLPSDWKSSSDRSGKRVYLVAEALGDRTDVRLAAPLPTLEHGQRENHPFVQSHDPPGDDSYDAQPPLLLGRAPTISLPKRRVSPPYRTDSKSARLLFLSILSFLESATTLPSLSRSWKSTPWPITTKCPGSASRK